MMMNENPNIDILIYGLGYESRAIHCASNLYAKNYIALAFPECEFFSYRKNYDFAVERNHQIYEFQCGEIYSQLKRDISAGDYTEIGVDISSMTREMMSGILNVLIAAKPDCTIVLYYTLGKYKPPASHDTFIDFNPIKGMEGWSIHPERPLSVILGLGYETDQAVGIVEYFDPSGTWAFIPNGSDSRYREDITESNKSLWPFVLPKRCVEYNVNQPIQLYSELRGLVEVLSKRSRVIIVPAGPKIFSAIAILVGLEIGNEVSLWRASNNHQSPLADTLPENDITQFRYNFSPLSRTGAN